MLACSKFQGLRSRGIIREFFYFMRHWHGIFNYATETLGGGIWVILLANDQGGPQWLHRAMCKNWENGS